MGKSKISWCDRVWNPVTGCTKISAGCRGCYASRMAKRLAGRFGYPQDEPFKVTLHWDRLGQPLHWRKPQRVFVDSMSDLFHTDVPDDFIASVFWVMAIAEKHISMTLTKRPDRMLSFFKSQEWYRRRLTIPNYKNIWLGVSVEDQKTADERIPLLLQTPAAVRFVSYEPALAEVNFDPYVWIEDSRDYGQDRDAIDWLIMGCESGPGARPMDIEWARSVRDQCQAAGVPFFLKQMVVDGKLVHMPELDGKVWDQIPEVK